MAQVRTFGGIGSENSIQILGPGAHKRPTRREAARQQARGALATAIQPVLEVLEARQMLSVSAGHLDTSFNGTGTQITDFAGAEDQGAGVVVEPSTGDVVVAGTSNGMFAVASYSPTGAMLNSVTTQIGTSAQSEATSIALDPSGKVLVGGYTAGGATNNDFVAARYTISPTGQIALDTSFGGVGYVQSDVAGARRSDVANDIAVQPVSGGGYDVLLAGVSGTGPTAHDAVARYTSAGVLDTSFGTSGFVVTSGTVDTANAIAVDSSGDIALAGVTGTGNTPEVVFVSPAGGTTSRHSVTLGSSASLNAIVFNPVSGEYLVAGTADGNAVVAEVTSAGALDTSFGTGGKTETTVDAGGAEHNGLALELPVSGISTGRIIAAGSTSDNSGDTYFEVTQYSLSGIADANFGTGGTATTDFPGGNGDISVAQGVAIQPNGKIVAAGYTDAPPTPDNFAVASYVADNAPTATSNTTLDTIDKNQTTSAGDTVAKIVAGLGAADVDGNPVGIAVTGIDDSQGTFQYSTDGGVTFTNIPTTVSDTAAFLLAQKTGSTSNVIRFVPAAGFTGTAVLTVRAWNETQGSNLGTYNTAASAAGNLNAFSDNSYSVTQTVGASPSADYVDYRWTGDVQGQQVTDTSGHTHTFGIDAFADIQDGVTYVAPGGTVNVDSGQYNQSNITIVQPVTIVGQSESGVTVAPSVAGGNAFEIASSNVTVKDLTIDGNANSSLTGTLNFVDGVQVNYNAGEFDNTVVDSVAFKNLYANGAEIYDYNGARVTTGNAVQNSTFMDIGTAAAEDGNGYAILMVQSSGIISNNVITDVVNGIGTNFSTQYPTYAPTINITGNNLSAFVPDPTYGAQGMDLSGLALDSTVSGNTIDTTGDGGPGDYGVILQYLSDVRGTALKFTGNTIKSDGNDTGLFIDHRSFGVSSTFTPVNAASDTYTYSGTVSAGSVGVLISDYDGYSQDNSAGTVSGSTVTGYATGVEIASVQGYLVQATVTGNNISGPAGGTAILVSGANASASITDNTTVGGTATGIDLEGGTSTVTGNTFAGNALDLKVASGATLTAVTGNTFSGAQFIDNESAQNIDATTDTFNVGPSGSAVVGNSLTTAEGFATEDKITDVVDKPGVGFVRIKSGTVFDDAKSEATTAGSLQRAVDAASAGDTLDVQAGTYVGSSTPDATDGLVAGVVVDKSLTILGPQTGLNPSGTLPSTAAQAVVVPGYSDPNVNDATESVVFEITTSDVTIQGLTVDGSNAALAGHYQLNGQNVTLGGVNAPIDAAEGIVSYKGVGGVNVSNDIVQNTAYAGVDLYNYDNGGTPTTDSTVSDNLIRNLSDAFGYGVGVILYDNAYAQVTGNVLSDVYTGVQLGNFYLPDPDASFAPSISGNTIAARHTGIFDNLVYESASTIPVSNNAITAVAQPAGESATRLWTGILVTSQQPTVSGTFTNNMINGTGATDSAGSAGYDFWNDPTTGSLAVTGGSVTGVNYGVWANSYEGYNSAGGAVSASISGVSINASTAGVYVEDSAANSAHPQVSLTVTGSTITAPVGVLVSGTAASASVSGTAITDTTTGIDVDNGTLTVGTGDTINGGVTGLILNGSTAAVTGLTLGNVAFNGPSGNYITLSGTAEAGSEINATGVSFNGVTGATTTLAGDYAIEDKITDVIDAPGVGFVRIKAGTVFDDAASEATTAGSLQRAVDAASPGDTLDVAAGTYVDGTDYTDSAAGVVGELYIDKPVTIDGPQTTFDGLTDAEPSVAGQAIIEPGVSDPNLYDSTAVIDVYVDSSNVTIQGVTVDGRNESPTFTHYSDPGTPGNPAVPTHTGPVLVDGQAVDASEGIASYSDVGNVNISNDIVEKTAYTGIDFENGANYSGNPTTANVISENLVEHLSDAYDYGVGILVYDNFYASIADNKVTDALVGIQTGNFYLPNPGAAGSAGITGNDLTVGAVGVVVNNSYEGASDIPVTDNTIDASNDPAGEPWAGVIVLSVQSGVDQRFTGDTINGTGASDTTGQSSGFEFWNDPTTGSLEVTGNSISGVDYGVWVNSYEAYPNEAAGSSDPTVSDTTITANKAGVYVEDSPQGDHAAVGATVTGSTITAPAGVLVSGTAASASVSGTTITDTTTGIEIDNGTLTVGTGDKINGGVTGLLVNGSSSNVSGNSLSNLAFNGPSGNFITLSNSAESGKTIDGTAVTFNGLTGATATMAQDFAIEDKITDALDNSALGLIRIKAGTDFVTQQSETNQAGAISRAVAAAAPGDTIDVQAGTFLDNVTVGKSLTIDGANAGIAGYSANRGSETTVIPTAAQTAVFTVSGTTNVTIDGLTIDGYNPNATGSAALYSGDQSDVLYAIHTAGTVSGLTVQNDIIKRVFVGFRGDGLSTGNLISANDFDSIGNFDFGYAVTLRTDFYANVTNNVMTRVWTGVHINDFHNPGGPATFNVSGNTIQDYAGGVMDWLQYGSATPLTLNNDKISVQSGEAPVANNFGISIVSLQNSDSVSITNDTITGADDGVVVFDASTGNPVTLGSTDAITGSKLTGVLVTDNLAVNPIGTTNFLAGGYGAAETVDLAGVAITGSAGTGVLIDASGNTSTGVVATAGTTINGASGAVGVEVSGALASASLTSTAITGVATGIRVDNGSLTVGTGDTVNGGTTGLVLNGSTAAVAGLTLNNVAFNNQSGNYVTLASGAENGKTIDATSATFNGLTGATATLAQDYAIVDKITDAVDETGVGFVRIKAGNVFVTPNSFVTPATDDTGAISRAVGVASDGDTVHIESGLYHETQVVIGKGLTLVGDSESGTVIDGGGESKIINSSSGVLHVSGNSATQPVTIEDLTVQNPGEPSNFAFYDAPSAIEGISLGGPLTIQNVTVTGQDDPTSEDTGILIVSGSTAATIVVQNVDVSKASQGLLIEDVLAPTTLSGSHIHDLITTTYDGITYPAEGALILTDSGNVQNSPIIVTGNTVDGYNGYGLLVEAGYGNGTGTGRDTNVQVTGNTVSVAGLGAPDIGIYNSEGSTSSGLTLANISGNTLSGDGTSLADGIDIGGFNSGISISGNTITSVDVGIEQYTSNAGGSPVTSIGANAISDTTTAGIEVDGGSATIAGTTVTGSGSGVLVTGGTASVSGATLTGDTTGISVTGGKLTVGSGDTVNGGTTGLLVTGSTAAISGDTLSNLAFNAPSGNYITLAAGALHGDTINATGVSFDGTTGSALTVGQAYAVEDKITDAIDDESLGYINLQNGEVFVTPDSFDAATKTPSIQRGVDAAVAGDTVNVAPGTYEDGTENDTVLDINKGVTVLGTGGADVTTIDGNSTNNDYYIVTISAGNAELKGFTVTNPVYTGTADVTGVLVESGSDNAPLTGVTVTDNIIHDIATDRTSAPNGEYGINIEGENTGSGVTDSSFDDNTIYNIGDNDTADSGGAFGILSSGDVGQEVNGISIDGNTIYNISSPGLSAGIDAGYGSENVTINSNLIGTLGEVPIGIRTSTGEFGPVTIGSDTVENASVAGLSLNSPYAQNVSGGSYTGNAIGIDVTGGTASVGGATITGNTTGIEVDGGTATVTGESVTGSTTGLLVTGGAANVSGGSYSGDTTGLKATGGDLKVQGATITGDTTGVLISGGAVVDLGDNSNSNTTGLGSSTGGNTLTGYSGAPGNYAVVDDNTASQANVTAQNDDFGPVSSSDTGFIQTVIYDRAENPALSTVTFQPPQNVQTPPEVVYVSSSFAGDKLGSDPDGAGPATSYGYDAFPDIQDAIAAVATGGTVIVEAGTYTGPADITKNLTLEGNGSDPVIQAPAAITSQFTTGQADYAAVYVAPGVTATVENLTVDGKGTGNAYGDGFYGVAFYDASGTMSNVTVENIEQTPFNGVQGGDGIFVDNTDGVSRTVNVAGSTVERYQKNGVVFEGAGLTGNISGSNVTGAGTTGVIAQNGIEIIDGAVGNITGNTISADQYSGDNAATGVILYDGGAGSVVSGNTITNADYGIYAYDDAGLTTISGNDISGTTDGGIASDGNESAITGNNLHNGSGDGVDLYDSQNGSVVKNNLIQSNAGDGIYVDSTVSDTTTPLLVADNLISGNSYAGLEDGSTVPVNADFNYWGSASGPTADNNPNGTGDAILLDSGSSVVSFAPWLTSGTDTAPATPGFQPGGASAFGIYGSATATEGATYVINFTPSMDITSYTVNYGDGTTQTYAAGTASATHVFTEFGTYNVSSSANTSAGSVSSNIQVVVVGSAAITATSNGITATEGNAFTGAVGSFTDAAGASSNPSDLSAVIHWGDGATSTATITETTPTSGVFTVTGSHTYAEYGTYNVSYAVTEAGAASPFASNTSTAAVSAATITPTAGNFSATEGNAFSGSVGSFTDSAGRYSNPSDLSAVISWGDGATSTATLVETTPTSGVFTVDGAHTYAEYGTYSVSYVVTEAGAASTFPSTTATATVSAATITPTASSISATEGTAFNGSVGSFTDSAGTYSKPSDLSAVISWGDGATSAATLVETTPTSGVFTVEGSHTYGEYGTYPVSYVVTEAGATSTFTSTSATATVGASSYSVSGSELTATEGTALTGAIFGTITDAAGSYTNPNDLATTVSFGDGATATATLVATATPGVYSVEASHTYAEYGNYVTTITVVQAGGSTESTHGSVIVSAATITLTAKSITGAEGATLTNVSVGTLVSGAGSDANPNDLSAVINWGDGTATSTATLVESVSNPGTFDVEGTHTYGVYGPYTITITAVEQPNVARTATGSATITDVAPTGLQLSTNPPTINEDQSTTLSGSFTAPGTDTHTVTINYGDGTPNVVLNLGAGVTSFTNGHTYANNITSNTLYTISVTVADSTGASTSGTTSETVDYVTPTVTLSGSRSDSTNPTPNDAEGGTFTLTLGPVSNPGYAGGNRVQDYYINWGDGSAIQVVPASSLPETTGGTVTHVYEDGTVPQGTTTPTFTIDVDILDSNGYHPDAGTLGVVVYNLPPTATFSGSGNVSEGSAGNVLFFNQADPSPVDQAAGFTYSYDFGDTGTFEITNSTSSSATVPASDLTTPGTYVVRGRITDKDGGYTDYLHTITVVNVAPTVNQLSNVLVGAGASFSEMGTFTDPGNDAPWKVYVNYNYNASSNSGPGTLIQSSSSKSFTLGTTYATPGAYTVLVTVVDDQGASGTGTFTVTVSATAFAVTSFTPNPSGFDVTFNRALNESALNLYKGLSGTYGAADLTLTGPNGPVHGSFIYDPATFTGHFIATGGVLPVGQYSASLVGSTSAFQDESGNPLQSNDGSGNYDATFSIASVNDVVSAPDFARGPGQVVDVPSTATTGLPITLSNGSGVTAVDFNLTYNANDLTINGVTLSPTLQADGFNIAFNNTTPGDLSISIYGISSMPSGLQTLVYLNATVPSTATYGSGAMLNVTGLRINEGAIAGTTDEAVEKVAFLGDASGNKGYSAYDSSLIANVVVGNATGFDAFPLIDPVIIADVTQDGTLSGQDASLVADQSIGENVPQIPPIPVGVTPTAPATGLDPTVTIGTVALANPGNTITIPVSISDTTGLLGANFTIDFDGSQLQFVSATVGTADGNFSVFTYANNSAGTLNLGLADNSTALGAGSGTIAYLTFSIPAAAPSGTNPVTIAGADGGLNEGGLALSTVNGTVNVETPSVGSASVFYNASPKYDPKTTASVASSSDFNAIATDKTALLPGGTGSFANYTSYSLGLNGILVDFVGLAPGATFTAGDFTFHVGNNNTPSGWATAPAPVSVTAITGPNGDTYADIIWANNAIADEWLQVTVLSTPDTDLAGPVVFYYGNAIGETGNSTTDAKVDGTDVARTQSNQTGLGSASITNVYDFNRDGKVNGVDVALAQANQSGLNPLRLITVPGGGPSVLTAAQAVGASTPAAPAAPAAAVPAPVPAVVAIALVPAPAAPVIPAAPVAPVAPQAAVPGVPNAAAPVAPTAVATPAAAATTAALVPAPAPTAFTNAGSALTLKTAAKPPVISLASLSAVQTPVQSTTTPNAAAGIDGASFVPSTPKNPAGSPFSSSPITESVDDQVFVGVMEMAVEDD
jgi:uncharacterized delta-60 repeat protein